MALKAMTTGDVVDYVSDRDPSKKKVFKLIDESNPGLGEVEVIEIDNNATHFSLRPLDLFLMGFIYDNAQELEGTQGSARVGIKTRVNQTNIDAVRFGLAGLTNFKDAKDRPIRYETKEVEINGRKYPAVTDDVMIALGGVQLIQELAGKIKDISEVSTEEEKNSSGALSLSA